MFPAAAPAGWHFFVNTAGIAFNVLLASAGNLAQVFLQLVKRSSSCFEVQQSKAEKRTSMSAESRV